MDRELTRVELDELLPLYALDALDGEEHEQVARYVERDTDARNEVESLREAVAVVPPADHRAPSSLWNAIASSLDARPPDVPGSELLMPLRAARVPRRHDRRSIRLVAGAFAAAAIVAIAALGIQVTRQQDRINALAAEMHTDPMQQQVTAARARKDVHVVQLTAVSGMARAEIVMLSDGSCYFMDHHLPKLSKGSTYQLWAKVGDPASPRMVSLGVLGADPGIVAFHLSAPTIMFEVTKEAAPGSVAPTDTMVMSGTIA